MRLRSFIFYFCFSSLCVSQTQYVCSLVDFRRMIGNSRVEVESVYTHIVQTCAQISNALTYASKHPSFFPGVLLQSSQLQPCSSSSSLQQQQLWLPTPHEFFGIHVLNKTSAGVSWDSVGLDAEIQFLRPILHILPTLLLQNPDSQSIMFVGHAMDCATVYSFPPQNLCGSLPDNVNLCKFYNERYNLYSQLDVLQEDYEGGGHWSEPVTSGGNLTNSFSIPVVDSSGKFRVQVSMDVSVWASRTLFDTLRPSEHGFTFLIAQEGHVIYAEQKAIDILFGADSQLTLEKITRVYTGDEVQAGISLSSAHTPFSVLPSIFKTTPEGNMILPFRNLTTSSSSLLVPSANSSFGQFSVFWARFEKTVKTWYLVGMTPRDELEKAAEWSVSPLVVNLSLSDSFPQTNVTFLVKNTGYLEFVFDVELTPVLQASGQTKFRLLAGESRSVEFVVHMGDQETTNSRFLTPFYATPEGYGACFRPQYVDLTINYTRNPSLELRGYTVIVVCTLCGFTTLLVFLAFSMLYRYRLSPPVLANSPRICVFTLVGILCLLIASVFNILPPTHMRCELSRWLFHMGFGLAAAATIAKNYRLRHIFYSKKLNIVPLVDWKLMSFIAAVVCLDGSMLAMGTSLEPYELVEDTCRPTGWVVYVLLILTKICLWVAAFVNTITLSRVPVAFADTRLNGVLVLGSILACVYLGLQFTGVLKGTQIGLLFIGSMFIWFGAFMICCHMLLKLRSGFVVVLRLVMKANAIPLAPLSSQSLLRSRLEALLEEMESKLEKSTTDIARLTDNLEDIQRLLFVIRANLLTFKAHKGEYVFDEEMLEKHLPEAIKVAFEKNERGVTRRLEVNSPPKRVIVIAEPTDQKSSSTEFGSLKKLSTSFRNRRSIVPADVDLDAAPPEVSPTRETSELLDRQA